jgi:hypothetical protein
LNTILRYRMQYHPVHPINPQNHVQTKKHSPHSRTKYRVLFPAFSRMKSGMKNVLN